MKSKIVNFLFGKDLWCSRLGAVAAFTFANMLWFVIDWCMGTTFRSMSIWILWTNNLLAAAILTLPYLLTRRLWFQLAVMTVVDLILVANLMYSRTYFTGIPPESYLLVSNLSDFTASVWDSFRWSDAVFAIILTAEAIVAGRMPEKKISHPVRRFMAVGALPLTASVIGIICAGGFHKEYGRLVNACYTSSCGVPAYTVAGHVAYNIIESRKADDPAVKQQIASWLTDHSRLMPATPLPHQLSPRKNLVIILLESFESWPIEKEIDGKQITPYINELIADSTTLYAPNIMTQVAAGRSIDGQLMITTGLLPMEASVFSTKYPGTTYPSLNKALRNQYGSQSSIFTVDQLITWNFGVIAKQFGYDHIYDRSFWTVDERVGNPGKLSDGSFFRQSVEKLPELWPEGTPAMLTFVTYSGHNPFILPDKLKQSDFDLSESGLPEVIKNYATMAHYTDSQLHTLIDYLRSRSDYAETLIMITGDHEGLANQRMESRRSSAKAAAIVDEGQFTPLIILNSPIAGRYDKVLGQVDIYPTLLTLTGAHGYDWPGVGQSIFAPDKIPAAISSMTLQMAGDTAGVAPEKIDHWQQARHISDLIIRTDYLKQPDNE